MSTNNPTEKRLRILSNDELKNLYDMPNFTFEERETYFSLSQTEKELLKDLHTMKSKTYFILQLAYFRAKHQFFTFELSHVKDDVQYILKYILNTNEISNLNPIDKDTKSKQESIILKLFNYRVCDNFEQQKLEEKSQKAAAVCGKPIYIFREVINYLSEKRIVLPTYRFIRDTIGKTLTNEQNRLTNILQSYLNQDHINSLSQLFENPDGLYSITQIKHEPKDFKYSEIKNEINRGKKIELLFLLSEKLLPKMDISNESIKYYASLVNYYSVYKLKRLDNWTVYLYLLCFIHHRYQQMNDNLINTFIYNIRNYIGEAKVVAKEKIYEINIENNQNIKKAGKILEIFLDDSIHLNTPFESIQKMAFNILEKDKLKEITNKIIKNAKPNETALQWQHIDSLTRQFQQNIRPILSSITFHSSSDNDPLISAIDFIKDMFIKGKSIQQCSLKTVPTGFIPSKLKQYIFNEKTLLANRYVFLVYTLLKNRLEAGDIFCHESIRYRSFEDDLIDNEKWQNKEALIADTGLEKLNQPIHTHLADLELELEKRILEVNSRIHSGDNKYLDIKKTCKNPKWVLKYPNDTETVNHSFFNEIKSTDISTIIHFVNQQCNFFEAFEHILGRYHKQNRDNRVLTACLIAWGTNMGLGRMSEISDISYYLLSTNSDNFLRLETLEEANDIICNKMSDLSIFEHYNIDGMLHSSSDGQKKEVILSTINARHSPKYFGLSKGIVEYNLVVNNVPVNAKIIGANEHESHFVYDILYNNSTDIKPEIHSTDTHGTNEVNFGILSLFGYQFAPRYKDIHKVITESLYGFKHPSNYDGIIKPVRKINKELIVDEWENIKRIMVSLALKTTTQNVIVRKLSSHLRKNKTKRALWEYDNIHKSIYLLNYIDIPKLRKNVQLALNRGESYHKLKKAVSYANFGKLRYKNEYEQQIWSACSRLLSNCIIYYNASILSELLDQNKQMGNEQIVNMLKRISPVAWQHINLYGRYEFNRQTESVYIDEIIAQLLSKNTFFVNKNEHF